MTILGIAGSLREGSFNRGLIRAARAVAPDGVVVTEFDLRPIPPFDADVEREGDPTPVAALKQAIRAADAVLIATPEYNRGTSGVLKNAIDWASRPWGQNSFDHIPAAVIGASIGQIGTAVAQQSLRGVLAFCNAGQMTAPEAYIHFSPEVFREDGEIARDDTMAFLTGFMQEFRDHIMRVLTVLPRQS